MKNKLLITQMKRRLRKHAHRCRALAYKLLAEAESLDETAENFDVFTAEAEPAPVKADAPEPDEH